VDIYIIYTCHQRYCKNSLYQKKLYRSTTYLWCYMLPCGVVAMSYVQTWCNNILS
jgi:hypothetical protein